MIEQPQHSGSGSGSPTTQALIAALLKELRDLNGHQAVHLSGDFVSKDCVDDIADRLEAAAADALRSLPMLQEELDDENTAKLNAEAALHLRTEELLAAEAEVGRLQSEHGVALRMIATLQADRDRAEAEVARLTQARHTPPWCEHCGRTTAVVCEECQRIFAAAEGALGPLPPRGETDR